MISVPYRTSSGNSWIPIESWLFPDNRLFLLGDITSESACEFVQKVMYLAKENSGETIKIYINSPGGEVDSGLLIYDTLKGLSVEYDIYCIGIVASIASVIFAGGQKGRRYILPHSRVMIHEPLIMEEISGSTTNIQRAAEIMQISKRLTIKLLSADTGKTVKEIEKAISYDNYMNAEETIKFGICDHIVNSIC